MMTFLEVGLGAGKYLLQLCSSGVHSCHIGCMMLAVMQLHNLATDFWFQRPARPLQFHRLHVKYIRRIEIEMLRIIKLLSAIQEQRDAERHVILSV